MLFYCFFPLSCHIVNLFNELQKCSKIGVCLQNFCKTQGWVYILIFGWTIPFTQTLDSVLISGLMKQIAWYRIIRVSLTSVICPQTHVSGAFSAQRDMCTVRGAAEGESAARYTQRWEQGPNWLSNKGLCSIQSVCMRYLNDKSN